MELAGALFSAVENPYQILKIAAREFFQAAKKLETTDRQGAINSWIGAASCRLDLGKTLLAKRKYISSQKNLELAKRLFDRTEQFDLAQKSILLALCAEFNLDPNSAVSKLAMSLKFGKFEKEMREHISPENVELILHERDIAIMQLELQAEALSLAT